MQVCEGGPQGGLHCYGLQHQKWLSSCNGLLPGKTGGKERRVQRVEKGRREAAGQGREERLV